MPSTRTQAPVTCHRPLLRLPLLLALATAASCSALFPFLGRYDIARRRIAGDQHHLSWTLLTRDT